MEGGGTGLTVDGGEGGGGDCHVDVTTAWFSGRHVHSHRGTVSWSGGRGRRGGEGRRKKRGREGGRERKKEGM